MEQPVVFNKIHCLTTLHVWELVKRLVSRWPCYFTEQTRGRIIEDDKSNYIHMLHICMYFDFSLTNRCFWVCIQPVVWVSKNVDPSLSINFSIGSNYLDDKFLICKFYINFSKSIHNTLEKRTRLKIFCVSIDLKKKQKQFNLIGFIAQICNNKNLSLSLIQFKCSETL